ncbi:MAG: MATE family efflux transporter [Flammeovirgaceae bacterium]
MILRSYYPHYKENLKLAIPVIISQAGQMLTGIADNAMVGQVDKTLLAASAFSNSVFNIWMLFGLGFTIGLTPLVGVAYGKKDFAKIGNLFRHSLIINAFITLLLFCVLIFIETQLHLFGQEENVLKEAYPYYRIITYSLVPFLLFMTAKQFAEGVESTKPAMIFTLLSNLLNVFLNYTLIYGNFGFEPMGLVGAGIATLWARIFQTVGMWTYLLFSRRFRPFLVEFFNNDFQLSTFKEIFRISLPIAFQIIIEVAAFVLGTIMMGWVGTAQLAAHQIALGLCSLTFLMASGFSTALTIRASSFMGAKDFRQVRLCVYAGIHLTLLFMAFTSLIFVIWRYYLAELHSQDLQVIQIAASLLLIAALFQLFDGTQVVSLGALRGIADVRFPTFMVLIAHGFITVPVSYFLTFTLEFREVGIWIGFLLGLAVAAILLLYRFEVISKRMLKQNQQGILER